MASALFQKPCASLAAVCSIWIIFAGGLGGSRSPGRPSPVGRSSRAGGQSLTSSIRDEIGLQQERESQQNAMQRPHGVLGGQWCGLPSW